MPRTIPVTSFLSYTLAVLTLGLVVAPAIPAAAQVVIGPSPSIPDIAAGPYYALPSWDQSLPVSTRFLVLANMGQQAVLDRETGLVWERTPVREMHLWYNRALLDCLSLNVGGRRGWRLPSAPEMMSLMGREVHLLAVALPTGHPFDTSNITALGQPERYFWTTTVLDYNATSILQFYAFVHPHGSVHMRRVTNGGVDGGPAPAWCVRGPGSSH